MLIEKNPECIFNEIEDTAVILNPSTEKFIELNATGLLIWKELDQTNSLDELISNMQKNFLWEHVVFGQTERRHS